MPWCRLGGCGGCRGGGRRCRGFIVVAARLVYSVFGPLVDAPLVGGVVLRHAALKGLLTPGWAFRRISRKRRGERPGFWASGWRGGAGNLVLHQRRRWRSSRLKSGTSMPSRSRCIGTLCWNVSWCTTLAPWPAASRGPHTTPSSGRRLIHMGVVASIRCTHARPGKNKCGDSEDRVQ